MESLNKFLWKIPYPLIYGHKNLFRENLSASLKITFARRIKVVGCPACNDEPTEIEEELIGGAKFENCRK